MLLPSKLIMENPLKWQKEAHAVYPSTVKKTKASNPLMNNSKTSKSLSAQNAHASAYSKFDKKSKNAFGVSFSIFRRQCVLLPFTTKSDIDNADHIQSEPCSPCNGSRNTYVLAHALCGYLSLSYEVLYH